jgi:putative tricarboxylic transport membrane protein
MAAIVLGLAAFGSFAVQQSMGDVYVMVVLGTMMYFLERFGFSAAPLVLGLILGPIAESNFVTGSLISTAQNGPFVYFFTGGLNILLVSIVILSVGFSIWSEFNSKRQSQ